jgi:hypothetical protein
VGSDGSTPAINKSGLTESAELHLLEATSHMIKPVSAQSLTNKQVGKIWDETSILSGSREEQEEQQRQLEQRQLGVLHELSNVLVKQIHTLLGHTELERYGSEIADAVAHKISCMASLSKCMTSRLKNEHMSLFEPAAVAVSAACHTLGSFASVRAKVVVFLHRMVAMLGVNVIDLLGHIYPYLLQYSDASDTDLIVQVLNQALVEFHEKCGGLVDSVFGVTCDKFEDLIRQFEMTQMQNRWAVEHSSNATLSGLGIPIDTTRPVVTEAPHIDLERASLHRQYIVFLQHVTTQKCEVILLSQTNQHRLEGVLARLLKAIRGEGFGDELLSPPQSPTRGTCDVREVPRLSVQSGLNMRKSAVASLLGLTKAWDPSALQDAQRSANVSPQLVTAFKNYMFEQALPLCLGGIATGYTVGSGTNSAATSPTAASLGGGVGRGIDANPGLVLNLADAQTQNIVIEIASLVYATIASYGKDEVLHYLQNALPVFGWGQHSVQALLTLIVGTTEISVRQGGQSAVQFREGFKKIFRVCHQ